MKVKDPLRMMRLILKGSYVVLGLCAVIAVLVPTVSMGGSVLVQLVSIDFQRRQLHKAEGNLPKARIR